MAIVDIVIFLIIGICALMGLLFGAGKSIWGLINWTLSFVAAFILTKFVADKLFGIPMVADLVAGGNLSLFTILKDGFGGFFGGISPNLTSGNGILAAIFTPFTETAIGNASVLAGAVSEHDATVLLVAYAVFSAIVCLLLFVVIRLIMMIIGLIVRSFKRNIPEQPKAFSRLVGFGVSGVKGLSFVVMIFAFICFLLPLPFMNIVTEQIDNSSVGKPLFSAIAPHTTLLLGADLDATLDKLLEQASLSAPDPEEQNDPVSGLSATEAE